jgi:DNA mismatch repair protein MutS2
MRIYPSTTLDDLHFDFVTEGVASLCAGHTARSMALEMKPVAELLPIERSLRLIDYLRRQFESENYVQLDEYEESKDLERCLRIENYQLSRPGFQNLISILRNLQAIVSFVENAEEIESVPGDLFPVHGLPLELIDKMEQIFDLDFSIKPDASPELLRLYKSINRKENDLSTIFSRLAKKYKSEGLLSDIEESHKNGRRVLALPVENKRQIGGVIHGESDSGKTIYLEPQAVTEVNNAIFRIRMDIHKEENRLLKDLSKYVYLNAMEIQTGLAALIQFDFIRAKCIFSQQHELVIPEISPKPTIHLQDAFHPLLAERLKAEEETDIILNDIILYGKNRILLISGPNAGGKSVLLKTAVFAQLLFQCGLPTPASDQSRMSVFAKLFVDIGDKQSIDSDLSTYSSHLLSMKQILDEADGQSLIILDEFGTGTDPRVGGALAESMLNAMKNSKAHGIITTHYSNLKAYATRTIGIVNGSMNFDMSRLSPTYELTTGRPGSSFAFEIAKRIGLPEKVINQAKRNAGSETYKMEQLISGLMTEKQQIEARSAELQVQEKQLKLLRNSYDQLKKELDIMKKRSRSEKKTELVKQKAEQQKQLETLLNDIREKESKEAAKKAVEKIKEEQLHQIREIKTIRESIYREEGTWAEAKDLKIGDYVRIRDTDTKGKVSKLGKDKATVEAGLIRLDVPYGNLMKVKQPLNIKSTRSVSYDYEKRKVPVRLDIRGLPAREAEEVVVKYVDSLISTEQYLVQIVHGKGNGVLKNLVAKVLQQYKEVDSFFHPPMEQGGDGVTVIKLH